jgi:hypothetical protein
VIRLFDLLTSFKASWFVSLSRSKRLADNPDGVDEILRRPCFLEKLKPERRFSDSQFLPDDDDSWADVVLDEFSEVPRQRFQGMADQNALSSAAIRKTSGSDVPV